MKNKLCWLCGKKEIQIKGLCNTCRIGSIVVSVFFGLLSFGLYIIGGLLISAFPIEPCPWINEPYCAWIKALFCPPNSFVFIVIGAGLLLWAGELWAK